MSGISAVMTEDSKIYYKPDGGKNPVIYADKAVAEKTVAQNAAVKVLFEIEGYYCIQTDKYTGFVEKSAVKLASVPYTIGTSISDITVNKGESIDVSSVKITEFFTDGSTERFSFNDCAFALPRTDVAGQKKMMVTKNGFSVLVNVTVIEPQVIGIIVEKTPSKMVYARGESFDPAELLVKAVYDNGKAEDVTEKVAFDYSFDEQGESLVCITYEAFSEYLFAKVYEKPKISLLNTDGYAGQMVEVSVFSLANGDAVAPSVLDVTISYDASKLQYAGMVNGYLYTVTEIDADTLHIVSKNTVSVSENILAKLLFKLKTDESCHGTNAEITIDCLTLSDDLGNQYATVADNTLIFNLGQISVTFFADDGDTEFMVKKVNYGEMLRISDAAPVLKGFDFKGWRGTDDVIYYAGDIITCTDDLSFCAVWEEIAESTTESNSSASESLTETTSVSESSTETTSVSESSAESTSVSESSAESTSVSVSSTETTSGSESSAESTSVSVSSTESTSVSVSSTEATSVGEPTAETTIVSASRDMTASESGANRGDDASEKQPLISDKAVVIVVIGICVFGILLFIPKKRKSA